MKRLVELKKKTEKACDATGWKKIDNETQKVTRAANRLIREHQKIDYILNNLNKVNLNDLYKAKEF